jgi:nucleotide-binding universal stress UspA family protein
MSTAEQLWISPVRLNNILFAMDFSPGALLAFPFALSIAKRYGGKIFLAHIVPEADYGTVAISSRATLTRMESAMEEALSSPLGSLRDTPHELLFDHGSICSRLLAAADRCGIDLIVIGTHGWRGIKKLLKGSTAEEIASLATRPVLTTGPKVDAKPEFKRILYATDFSDAAAEALPYALSLTLAFDARLVFLHVNDWSSKEPPVEAQAMTFDFVRDQLLRSGYGRAMEGRFEVIVDFGSRAELVVNAASEQRADLIVMGAHTGGGIRTRIAAHLPGSLFHDITAEAPCPVLTVPFAPTPAR